MLKQVLNNKAQVAPGSFCTSFGGRGDTMAVHGFNAACEQGRAGGGEPGLLLSQGLRAARGHRARVEQHGL